MASHPERAASSRTSPVQSIARRTRVNAAPGSPASNPTLSQSSVGERRRLLERAHQVGDLHRRPRYRVASAMGGLGSCTSDGDGAPPSRVSIDQVVARPTGHETPVPASPQYRGGLLARPPQAVTPAFRPMRDSATFCRARDHAVGFIPWAQAPRAIANTRRGSRIRTTRRTCSTQCRRRSRRGTLAGGLGGFPRWLEGSGDESWRGELA